jgi:SAM-dependent methyltransferase
MRKFQGNGANPSRFLNDLETTLRARAKSVFARDLGLDTKELSVTLEGEWDKRVKDWHAHVMSAAAFTDVLERLLTVARPRPEDVCLDLGAGTGFVTLALAPKVVSVLAVDISPRMADALATRAQEEGHTNVMVRVADLARFDLPPGSADLVVSNYALHHLSDAGKRDLVARAAAWLRPEGRLVIADMMFGRGQSRRDRAILRQKVTALTAKGPGGWWRVAKNVTRYGLGVGNEHPASPEFWQGALRDNGLTDVGFEQVFGEAGIVFGTKL